ncbi:hypothetical protein GOP47_0022985 [Adiantum capillus-veneris]|uniref:Retrotransposon gag domain-containing protein n=1 Tax=Adiantum capillus-veneris TaxID=13818 RepID=A0A9D4U8S0_ADICA|nr:hypothetical protein GOP47_0022985 [Adiantum capillus-veneris]
MGGHTRVSSRVGPAARIDESAECLECRRADKGKGQASTSGVPASGSDGMGRFKPIKPTPYSGQRDSLILEKWTRDTESFFRTSKMEERLWTSVVSHFLEGDAYNWFLLEERKNPYISWTCLKAEMRDYFVPRNEDFRHLDEWRALTQGESKLQDYEGLLNERCLGRRPWKVTPSRPCRSCGGPHWDGDCHKANSQTRAHSAWANETNADRTGTSQVQITEITEQEAECGHKESTKGTVHVGDIKASVHYLAARIKPIPNMYVKTVINGKSQLAMLDSRASHNFISPSCAKCLGVKTCKPGGGRSISLGFVQGKDSNMAMAYDVAV